MVENKPTKESSDSSKIQKGLPLKPDPYVEEIKVWIAQRVQGDKSCRQFIAYFKRERAHLLRRKRHIDEQISHLGDSIILEIQQLRLMRRAIRDAKRDLRKYLKRKGK